MWLSSGIGSVAYTYTYTDVHTPHTHTHTDVRTHTHTHTHSHTSHTHTYTYSMALSSEGNALQFNLDLEELKRESVEMMVGRDGDEDSSQFSMSPREQHDQETEMCLRMFETWAQTRQTEFVEQVIARMSFNQHEHLYTILMPMLQRDFITVLPSKWLCVEHLLITLYCPSNSLLQVCHCSTRYYP